MAKERCWRCNSSCKKFKNNVKLCACDDRLCEECYEANESLLRKLQVGVADTAVDVTVSRKPVAASKLGKQKATPGHVKNNGRHNSTESNTSIGEGTSLDTTVNSSNDSDIFMTTKTTSTTAMSTGITADNYNNYCPICNEPAEGCKLKCDICKEHIHDHCSGLESGTVRALLNIIHSRGWTCMNCRSGCEDHKSKVNELQCKLSQVGEHLSDVLLKVDALERKLSLLEGKDACRGVHQQFPQSSEQAVPVGPSEGQDLATEVHRVLADACRRKKNIVVSGLPEVDTSGKDVTVRVEH